MDLKERNADYFNSTDVYLCYDETLKNLFLSKLELYNGYWHTLESLKYKVTTIDTQNCSELYHTRVKLKGLEYHGTIVKQLTPNNIGVLWDQGKQVKQHGLANFWTELNKLEL